MLIALVNNHGGVGKTTLAVHLAAWLDEQGLRVAAIDADPKLALTRWLSKACPRIPVHAAGAGTWIYENGPRLAIEFDAVVADGPAGLCVETATLAGIADLCVLPIGPAMQDVWSAYRTAQIIAKVRATPKRAGLPHAFGVLTRVDDDARVAAVAGTAQNAYGFPIARRFLFSHASLYAASELRSLVWQVDAAGGAATEVRALFRELLDVSDGAPPRYSVLERTAARSVGADSARHRS